MPVGAGIVGGIGSVAGGLMGMSSSKKALRSTEREQERIRAETRPFVEGGTAAFDRISTPQKMMENFQASPDYAFRMKEGLDAVGQNAAFGGLLRSGGAMKDSMKYASNLASGEMMNHYNRERDIAGMGLQGVGINKGVADTKSQAYFAHNANKMDSFNSMMTNLGSAAGMVWPKG